MFCPRACVAAALVCIPRLAAVAQQLGDSTVARPARDTAFVLIGSPADQRLREREIRGLARAPASLLRTPSVTADTGASPWRTPRLTWVTPALDVTWNSDLAFSLNDGSQWAGRGVTVSMLGGVQARLGRARLNFVPQVWSTQNRPFALLGPADAARDGFSSPWHTGAASIDLPQRFGYEPTTVFDLGESAAWLAARGFAVGVSTESQWWGPGIRNALVMSNNAGGVPHGFVRTTSPLRTTAGDVEARWVIGSLSESRFFDTFPGNDLRSLSGAIFAFRPAIEPNLTVGAARVVFAGVRGVGALPARALDVFARWGEGANVRSATHGRAAEQLTSLFGRLALPASSAEVYGEWARMVLPASIRSLFLAPQFAQGFTVGIQWLPPLHDAHRLRVQLELTNLEQSPTTRAADTLSFYTSRAVAQGYTQRGQVVGAAIGPGSSSQWLAVDHLHRGGKNSVGVFLGRIRWDTDSYYRQPTSVLWLSYDATVLGGVRGTRRVRARDLVAELTAQQRYNHLFQNADHGFSRLGTFDQRNFTLRVRAY